MRGWSSYSPLTRDLNAGRGPGVELSAFSLSGILHLVSSLGECGQSILSLP